MVVLTKKIIDAHDLVIDTNILHTRDKKDVVNPEFESFWENHHSDLELNLKIPYMVFGELLFQQTSTAMKTLTRANEAIERLSEVASVDYGHRITESRIKRDIKKRLDTWVSNKKAEILNTPIEKIDWSRLIDDSIWRKAPFSFDPKKEELEKGFRDSIILETLINHAKENEDKPIIFVSGDKLLREAAEARSKKTSRIKVMESLEDVDAYFKLMRENFTETFVDSIIDKASLKFLNHRDNNCIAFKEELSSKLAELAGDLLTNPREVPGLDQDGIDPDEEWRPINKGQFTRVGKSQFMSLEDGHTFNWKEDVKFNRAFEVESWDGDVQQIELEIDYDVRWKSNVSENERFTKVMYLGAELVGSELSYR